MIGYDMIPKLAAEKKRGEEKRKEASTYSERSVDQIWERIVMKVEMERRFRVSDFHFFYFL